jgi:SNF2 family DNA or RNA helicase
MLREEQIDIRRKRAAEEGLCVQNLGRNRIFSDYLVSNPRSGGQYKVSIRGFELGENTCECPDFKTNTLGTCKHIEAVLAALMEDAPPQVRRKKATITQPEVFLNYGEQLRIGLHLPPRPSDALGILAERFFDERQFFKPGESYQALIDAVGSVPEQVTIFSDALEFMEREIERQEMAAWEEEMHRKLAEGTLDLDDPAAPLGRLLKIPLYGYQLEGALFLACRGRSILGDEMGLGKTIQTMAAIEILVRRRGIERVLVVAPASVKYQWQTEIQKFTERDVQVVDGTSAQRDSRYKRPAFYRLINYESAFRDVEKLNAWQPDVIVLDEAQRIKNWESKTTRAIKKLRSRYAIVLTGTPLENKLEELYSIVQFVDDRRLGPAFQFLHDHRILDATGKLLGYRNLEAIRERLSPILLRRTRASVLGQLPGRTDSTLVVEMKEEQRRLYAEHQHTLAILLQRKYLSETERRRVLCAIANLRMLCNSTALVDPTTNHAPKLEELEERLQDLMGSGPHKVVVFSQWEKMLHLVEPVLQRLGLGYVLLSGSVPGKDRRGLIEKFRSDPNCRVFLSTDAGGTGLNLQVADIVINLESPWNPAVLEQRIARVHRLGQHRPVQVYHLVTRDSIEDRVQRVVSRKRELFETLFQGTSDEVSFESVGQQTFLETVRELFHEETPTAPQETASPVPAPSAPPSALFVAGVQFLEALAESLPADPQAGRIEPEVLARGVAALRKLLAKLDPSARTP